MAWKNVREMDLDHIWNTDLLHIVDLPRHISKRHNKPLRHNNTRLSTNNPHPVLKTYEYDNPGFQDLRLYYRAAIKGSASLKLYQASLLFVDGDILQNYPRYRRYSISSFATTRKNSKQSRRYSINFKIGTITSHSFNEKPSPFRNCDIRVAPIRSWET